MSYRSVNEEKGGRRAARQQERKPSEETIIMSRTQVIGYIPTLIWLKSSVSIFIVRSENRDHFSVFWFSREREREKKAFIPNTSKGNWTKEILRRYKQEQVHVVTVWLLLIDKTERADKLLDKRPTRRDAKRWRQVKYYTCTMHTHTQIFDFGNFER